MSIKRRFTILILSLIIVIMPTIAFANGIAESIESDMKSSTFSVLGEGLMNFVRGIFSDGYRLASYIVTGVLIISLIASFKEFKNTENPQKIDALKKKMLGIFVGIVVAANFWDIYNFIINNVNLGLK